MTSPLWIAAIILLFIVNSGTPFFTQRRPGKNGKIFTILKFKTMTDARDGRGALLPDEQRLTTVGSWIRKLSIDELPQLLNVLKGDMSIVGPRPLLPGYLPLYSKEQSRRHEVKPGITGWAQVNGRNAVDWKTKLAMDVYYVKHVSFLLDCRIVFSTIQNVLLRKGITDGSSATTTKFAGNE